MSFDRRGSLRRLKPDKILAIPPRQPGAEIPLLGDPMPGRGLLLDTTVYIDILQNRLPSGAERLLQIRVAYHSSICLGELTYLLGRLDPKDRRTATVAAAIARAIDPVPTHRLLTPSLRAAGEAGIMAGVVERLRHGAKREQPMVNDALLYAQALERGLVVLTRNSRDFDLLDRLWPNDNLLLYEPT